MKLLLSIILLTASTISAAQTYKPETLLVSPVAGVHGESLKKEITSKGGGTYKKLRSLNVYEVKVKKVTSLVH